MNLTNRLQRGRTCARVAKMPQKMVKTNRYCGLSLFVLIFAALGDLCTLGGKEVLRKGLVIGHEPQKALASDLPILQVGYVIGRGDAIDVMVIAIDVGVFVAVTLSIAQYIELLGQQMAVAVDHERHRLILAVDDRYLIHRIGFYDVRAFIEKRCSRVFEPLPYDSLQPVRTLRQGRGEFLGSEFVGAFVSHLPALVTVVKLDDVALRSELGAVFIWILIEAPERDHFPCWSTVVKLSGAAFRVKAGVVEKFISAHGGNHLGKNFSRFRLIGKLL